VCHIFLSFMHNTAKQLLRNSNVSYVGCATQPTGRAVVVGGDARWRWRWGWGPKGRSPSVWNVDVVRLRRWIVLNGLR